MTFHRSRFSVLTVGLVGLGLWATTSLAAEFDLRGHLLADITLVTREAAPDGGIRLRIEALTGEDA